MPTPLTMLDDSPIGLVPWAIWFQSTEYCTEQRVDERVGDNIAFVRHQQAETFAFLIDKPTFRRKVVTGAGDLLASRYTLAERRRCPLAR